jgi:hypothetical protein
MAQYARQKTVLSVLLVVILSLLALQLIVGMAVNLYYEVPKVHPGVNSSNYMVGVDKVLTWAVNQKDLSLKVHVVSGLALVVFSLLFFIWTIAFKRKQLIGAAIAGMLGILIGAFNGASFLIYAKDYSSLIMAIGFLIAYSSYISSLFRNK